MELSSTIAGVLPVLVTPFTEKWSIDFEGLSREIDWVLDHGADGVTIAMVSEIQRLSVSERIDLAGGVVDIVRGRCPVIVSVGSESTVLAQEMAKEVQQLGASALMAAPPLLGEVSLSELRAYLRAIDEVSDLPLILQDASGYVGAPIPAAHQGQLVNEFGSERLLLKPEAVPIGATVSAILDATGSRARIFDGSGGLALMDTYLRGLAGTMPGPDLVWAIRALWDALSEGDEQYALELTKCVSALISMVPGLDGYVAFSKYMLVSQGVLDNTRMRGPLSFALDDVTRHLADLLLRSLTHMVKPSTGAAHRDLHSNDVLN